MKKGISILIMVLVVLLLNTEGSLAQTLPIKPARTISFTTTEGSYMDVDVSPDGKTLAFDLLGDLYTIPANGGTAKQLTRGMALHARPVWSPDGKKLAYISDESGAVNLNVIDLRGTFHKVLGNYLSAVDRQSQTRESSMYNLEPVWDPQGHYLAFDNHLYELDGKEITKPLFCPNPLRFSANKECLYGIDSGKLYSYKLKTKQKEAVSAKLDPYLYGQISPDGRWWCYSVDIGAKSMNDENVNSRRKLIALDLTSNSNHILIENLIVVDPRYKHGTLVQFQRFSFSQDSKAVYVGYGGKIHRITIETNKDQIIPFTAHVNVDLGAYDYHKQSVSLEPFKVKYMRSASESPNGKHLVFTALEKVYVMNLPNGKAHVLCPQPFSQFQPAWSADSKWIAYASWCDTLGGGYVWKVSVNGGVPRRLTPIAGYYQHPTWSPDGSTIAIVSKSERSLQRFQSFGRIELIPVNSSEDRKIITDSVGVENNLISFSKDGSKLLYTPIQDNPTIFGPQLVARNLLDNSTLTIADGSLPGNAYQPQVSLSPDGKYLVYSAAEDLYLVVMNNFSAATTIYKKEGNNLNGIRFAAGVDPHWENNGKILAWTYGNKFYKIDPDRVVTEAERRTSLKNPRDTAQGAPVKISIVPNQTLSMDVTVPSVYANGLLALKNVRILTMQGGKVIEHGTMLIRNGRIAAIGSARIIIPKYAKVLDLKGKTIMPGLIDLHLHFGTYPDGFFLQQDERYLAPLAYGVTTARDPSQTLPSFGTTELIRTDQMLGPRFYSVGVAVRPEDGVIRFDSPADADAVIRKRYLLGGTEIKQYTLPNRIQREWLIQACEKYGVNMTNEGYYSPLLQLGEVKDGSTGIEHTPVWGDAYNDVVTLRAKASTYLTATEQVAYGVEGATGYFDHMYWRGLDAKWQHFVGGGKMINGQLVVGRPVGDTVNPSFVASSRVNARIRHAGGSVVLGSHGNDPGIGPQNELWALQAGGLTNMEALQAGTINGAKALGIQRDIGSLEIGKIADLLILDKNPLDDIHNSREIRYVMQGGILYDANTLDEVWPLKKKCPEWKSKQSTKENIISDPKKGNTDDND